ncbi:PadR family transcriptional regulator [Actinoplanes xinjiangensis]|uniref:PadR family transcriptional regulator n=1 Tax=Actinoplanes xinjiangensis TaxID=512350 RepID=UPI00343AAC54
MTEKAERAEARSEPLRITRSFLDVVEAFLDAGAEELHGYAIIKTTGLGGPTVYKILERMAGMGWITARWGEQTEGPSKPRRRYYKLTSIGMQQARELIAERRSEKPARQAFRPAFGGGHL